MISIEKTLEEKVEILSDLFAEKEEVKRYLHDNLSSSEYEKDKQIFLDNFAEQIIAYIKEMANKPSHHITAEPLTKENIDEYIRKMREN